MSSKKLESMLLSDNINQEQINDYLERDYKKNTRELFVVLLNAIKEKTLMEINTILDNIEEIVLSQDSDHQQVINNALKETKFKLETLKGHRENVEIKSIRTRLSEINEKLLLEKEKEDNSNLYDFYRYLIFEEKNIEIIAEFLSLEDDILSKKDEFGNNLFYNILDHYSTLKENDIDEIKYFYDVIVLFLKNEGNDILRKDRLMYQTLLNRSFCKSKSHVRQIYDRLNDFYLVDFNKLTKTYGISTKFHDEIMKELDKRIIVPSSKILVDDKRFVTIDDEGALCLDDALGIKKNKDGSFTYDVAITDVPAVVPYKSKMYYEAMQRTETLYLIDQYISMFPEEIANNYCSLLPNQYRNVIIYRFLVDPSYNLDPESLEIINAQIMVSDRLNYKQVNNGNVDSELEELLDHMALLSLKLRQNNKKKEKYRAIENIVKPYASYHHSIYADSSISANIVQESMLLPNHYVPKYMANLGIPCVFRNHTKCDDITINNEIDRIFNSSNFENNYFEHKKLFNLVSERYLNASYGTENQGHYGLGYDYYAHISSPGRRFSDTINEYMLYKFIFNGEVSDKDIYEYEEELNDIVDYLNYKKRENNKFTEEYNYLTSKKLIRK